MVCGWQYATFNGKSWHCCLCEQPVFSSNETSVEGPEVGYEALSRDDTELLSIVREIIRQPAWLCYLEMTMLSMVPAWSCHRYYSDWDLVIRRKRLARSRSNSTEYAEDIHFLSISKNRILSYLFSLPQTKILLSTKWYVLFYYFSLGILSLNRLDGETRFVNLR